MELYSHIYKYMVPGTVHLYFWCPCSTGTAFCRN